MEIKVYFVVDENENSDTEIFARHFDDEVMTIMNVYSLDEITTKLINNYIDTYKKYQDCSFIAIHTKEELIFDLKEYIRNLGTKDDNFRFITCKFEEESSFEKTMSPVEKLVTKTIRYDFGNLGSFVNNEFELIVIPEINAYFRLEDVNTETDFYCKILHWLTFNCASNHWSDRYSPKLIKYINYILGTEFDEKEMDALYCTFGNGLNHELCIKFIKSGFDFDLVKKECCDSCMGGCFAKKEEK